MPIQLQEMILSETGPAPNLPPAPPPPPDEPAGAPNLPDAPDPGTIASVRELGHGRRHGAIQSEFEEAAVQRDYVRKFRVRTTGPLVPAADVLAAVDPVTGERIPAQWSQYPWDTDALAKSLTADETETPECWEVQVSYTTACADPEEWAADPLLDRPDISFDVEEYELALQQAVLAPGQTGPPPPILNSAGDPFDPPPTRPASRTKITVGRNEDHYDGAQMQAWANVTNSDVWWGYAVGSVLSKPVRAQRAYRNGRRYWRVSYTFLVSDVPWLWQLSILDRGYRKKPAVNGQLQPITLPGGRPLSEPALLDGNGNPLAVGSPAAFLKFPVYPSAAFAPLNLTQPE